MLPVSLALFAALLFAWGASLQQRVGRASLPVASASNAPVRRLHRWLPITASLWDVVRHPVWLGGWVVNFIGFGIQATALHEGTVALVQPVMVSQLFFTVPIAVLHTRRRPSLGTILSGVAVFAGVTLFIVNWGVGNPHGSADRERILGAALTLLGSGIVMVTVSMRVHQALRAVLEAIAAGLCFTASAALTKLALDSVLKHGIGTLVQWPAYLLAISTCLGLVIGQDALAAGHLSTTVAGMSITNPVASTVVGIYAFREQVPISAGVLAGLSCAGVLIVAGVIGTARTSSVLATGSGPEGDTGGLPATASAAGSLG